MTKTNTRLNCQYRDGALHKQAEVVVLGTVTFQEITEKEFDERFTLVANHLCHFAPKRYQ